MWDIAEAKKIFHALALKFKINAIQFCRDGFTIVAGTTVGMKLWKANADVKTNILSPGKGKQYMYLVGHCS